MRVAVAVAALLILLAAGCTSTDDSKPESTPESASTPKPTPKPKPKPVCAKATAALVGALRSSLTADGGGKLTRVRVVKVEDPPDAPLNGLRAGVYVASGELTASGIDGEPMSWAVSKSMLKTGGGLAFALDSVTREFSDLGAAAREGSPARDYADEIEASDAYEQSRSCVEG